MAVSGLQQTHDRLVKMRDEARAKQRAIVERVDKENREHLTESETIAVRSLGEQIAGLDERIGELAGEVARSGVNDPAVRELLQAIGGEKPPAVRGNHVAPLQFSEHDLRAMYDAARTRSTYGIQARRPSADELRAFSSPEQYLPAQLYPGIIGVQHENRLLDRIPAMATEAPSYEFVQHYSTTETDNTTPGTAAVTAEGALKPEVVLQTEKLVLPMLKIAVNTATSWESVSDWIQWASYVTNELGRIIVDAENNALLTGAGGTSEIQGLTTVSGSLSHAVGTGETPLDAIETSIAALRTGPALAEADLLILHPNSWSAIRKTKDNYGRYLVTANPTADTATSAWGVPVLVTTQLPSGDGVLLDTRKFGFAVVREPLFLRSGFANDDFVRNLIRYVAETRLNLAVTRPPAVLNISGLPTS